VNIIKLGGGGGGGGMSFAGFQEPFNLSYATRKEL
jgi:hypothetical protein